MVWKPALIRAMRSFLQGCVAVLTAFSVWLGAQSFLDLGDLKVQGNKVVLGLMLAATYALISFLQNVIELNWGGAGIAKLRG